MAKRKTGRRNGNGEGTIFQRTDGRYVGKVTLPGRRRHDFYGRTREEVANKLTDALRALRDGTEPPSDRLTFERFIGSWLDSVRPTLRERTHQRYGELIRCHAMPRLGRVRLTAVTPDTLQKLYADKIADGLAPATIGQLHRVLHNALGRAAAWGLTTRNPASLVKPPSVKRPEMRVLTSAQVSDLLRATADERLAAVYVLAGHTGMRQGEIFGLAWTDVDLDAGQLRVRTSLEWLRTDKGRVWRLSEPKTHASKRRVALTPTVVATLRRHRILQIEESLKLGPAWQQTGLVFTDEAGGPLVANNFTRNEFAKALTRAGLPRINFHQLRHTAASLALANGVPIPQVTRLLGHTSPAVTMSIYAHAIPDLERQAADALEKAISAG